MKCYKITTSEVQAIWKLKKNMNDKGKCTAYFFWRIKEKYKYK